MPARENARGGVGTLARKDLASRTRNRAELRIRRIPRDDSTRASELLVGHAAGRSSPNPAHRCGIREARRALAALGKLRLRLAAFGLEERAEQSAAFIGQDTIGQLDA